MIAFVGHPGEHVKTDRLIDLLASEEQSGCNTIGAYHDFAKRIEQMKRDNLDYLDNAKREGKKIFGMGAPVKGNTMLNYFGVGTETIDCLLEKNELRKGLYSPGMHIPILIEKEVEEKPDIYYVLAWNFKREILKNNQHLIDQGIEFFFPVNPKE
jgi:hypothetical protein